MTAERGSYQHVPMEWSMVQRKFRTIQEQWEEHQRQLGALAADAGISVPDEVGQAMEAVRLAVDEASVRAGFCERDPQEPGALRIRLVRLPVAALQWVRGMMSGSVPKARRRKDVASPEPANQEDETGDRRRLSSEELARRDVKRYRALMGGSKGLGMIAKLLLLVATLWISVAVFSGSNAIGVVATVMAVLLIHELGHWLPMKLFGYRNVTMFFIPGFGAAVSGRKLHAPAWQELLVLLGGPLPGILGGIGIFVAGYLFPGMPDWLLNAASIAVVINAFNLLPFLPLDGGRIVDLLLFREFPLLRVLFSGVSALVIAITSFVAGIPVLRYVAISMLVRAFLDLKLVGVVKMAKQIEWGNECRDEDEALMRIFREVREGGDDAFVGSGDWHLKVQAALEEVMRRRPGWVSRLAGGFAYGTACALPMGFLVGVAVLSVSGGLLSMMGGAGPMMEFAAKVPVEERRVSEAEAKPIMELSMATEEVMRVGDSDEYDADSVIERVAGNRAGLMNRVDRLNWTHVGILRRSEWLDGHSVCGWLEIANRRMESAMSSGRVPEAVRRAEVVMHAVQQLEPATSFEDRKYLWDAQARALDVAAKANASGLMGAEERKRLEVRINGLRRGHDAEVEAYLLVMGWYAQQLEGIDFEPEGAMAEEDDAAFFRGVYREIDVLLAGVGFGQAESASVVTARRWLEGGKVGDLGEMEAGVPVAKGEGDFVGDYCDELKRMEWRRTAVLSAMSLESYRLEQGRLPAEWAHELPGGAKLELVNGIEPRLWLRDTRDGAGRPAWTLEEGQEGAFVYQCPMVGEPVGSAGKRTR